MNDVTCNQVIGILETEHPPKIVEYDEPNTALKPYTQCSEKVSVCPVSNASSLIMKNAIER